MSNEDIGDAVAIPIVRAPQAAAPTKVASFDPTRLAAPAPDLGAGPNLEEHCTEEPSKPEPVFKTEIEYTAAARAEGIEGKLKLKIVVGADGSVLRSKCWPAFPPNSMRPRWPRSNSGASDRPWPVASRSLEEPMSWPVVSSWGIDCDIALSLWPLSLGAGFPVCPGPCAPMRRSPLPSRRT